MRRLLVHARILGATREEAEDLVHDALEVVVKDPSWFDPTRGELVSALKVIVRNRYLNRVRARSVRRRAVPQLRSVGHDPGPDAAVEASIAQTHRSNLLALLEPEERRLFSAWTLQRSGALPGPQAARSLDLTPSAYEAAKKRLRRRCGVLLNELGLEPADLFGPVLAHAKACP